MNAQPEVTQNSSFYISQFNHKADNQPKKVQITWENFLSELKQPKIRPDKDGKLFSGAIFNGERTKENALELSLLVLDCDDGTPLQATIAKCKKLDYKFAVYTTFNHSEQKHKFRIVFLLAIPVPANIYFLLWKWIVKQFPNADPQPKSTASMFYYPAIKTKDSPFYAESFDGKLLDWRELQDLVVLTEEQPKQQYQQSSYNYTSSHNNKSSYIQAALDDEVAKVRNATKGARNSTLNNAAFALGQLLHTNLIDEVTITTELEQAGSASGLPRNEVRRTIASGIAAGRKQSRNIPENDYFNGYQEKKAPTQHKVSRVEEKANKPKALVNSLKSLWKKIFPEIAFLVPGILPEGGVNLVVGKPKTGKSNLVTNLAVALACKGVFLNQKVEKANVLYLNLEDGERRLKQRLEAIIAENEQPPDNFDYISGISGIDAIKAIDEWLAQQQGKNLVVIDTLAKFRGIMPRGQNMYEYDYHSLQLLRELAEKYPVTFLVIHHSRKAESEDVLDNVSGSLGLSGACDNVFVLKRARGVADSELHIVGRDLEDKQLALRYSFPYWSLLGSAQEYAVTKERRVILDLLHKQGSLSLTAIVEAAQFDLPGCTYHSIKQLLYRMLQDGLLTSKHKGIYQLVNDNRYKNSNSVTSVTSVTDVTSVTSVTNIERKETTSSNTTIPMVNNPRSNANVVSNADKKSSVTTAIVVDKEDNLVSNASNASNASYQGYGVNFSSAIPREVMQWIMHQKGKVADSILNEGTSLVTRIYKLTNHPNFQKYPGELTEVKEKLISFYQAHRVGEIMG